MILSAPVYRLKRQARTLSRTENIPLHEALDRIARREGFEAWSLLAVRTPVSRAGKTLACELEPGEMVLLGARAGQGKTLLSLELLAEAMKAGHRGVFFTLEHNEAELRELFAVIGEDLSSFAGRFEFDNSDAISARHIIGRLSQAPRGTVAVVDYLQLLDQKRENPDLMDQVAALQTFARQRAVILVFISQIHWSYDPVQRPCPELSDVRLPNPLDLSLFSRTCFLNGSRMTVSAVAAEP